MELTKLRTHGQVVLGVNLKPPIQHHIAPGMGAGTSLVTVIRP